jgi:hypothetical protein
MKQYIFTNKNTSPVTVLFCYPVFLIKTTEFHHPTQHGEIQFYVTYWSTFLVYIAEIPLCFLLCKADILQFRFCCIYQ